MKTLFKDWWVILLQGLFLVTLSILIFNNPDTVLTTLALWLGIVILLGGAGGLASYFFSSKENRQASFLIISLITLILGGLLIANTGATQKIISVLFGISVAIIGGSLVMDSWNARQRWPNWWITGILGAIALVVGVSSIFRTSSGAAAISLLIGISVLSSGLGLIILAFVKRNIGNKIKDILQK